MGSSRRGRAGATIVRSGQHATHASAAPQPYSASLSTKRLRVWQQIRDDAATKDFILLLSRESGHWIICDSAVMRNIQLACEWVDENQHCFAGKIELPKMMPEGLFYKHHVLGRIHTCLVWSGFSDFQLGPNQNYRCESSTGPWSGPNRQNLV